MELDSILEGSVSSPEIHTIDYDRPQNALRDRIVGFLVGAVFGFAVLYIFYKIIPLSIVGAVIFGVVNIFLSSRKSIEKRRVRLRSMFFDLLEAMSVSMRAGNPPFKALVSARDDLLLLYPENSDIIVEVNLIIRKFDNAVPLSAAFQDLAERSKLEDIGSFASVYATIEGKSSRADEIIRETQEIITDKMSIEMEIDTMMTAAKNEMNIMLVLPLVIILIVGYMGGGFMSALYENGPGRVAATIGLILYMVSFFLGRKLSRIKV